MTSTHILLCLLIAAFASEVACNSTNQTKALQFNIPQATDNETFTIYLNPTSNITNFTSYSICLRAIFETWDEKWVFYSYIIHSLMLNDYTVGTGIYYNGFFPHQVSISSTFYGRVFHTKAI